MVDTTSGEIIISKGFHAICEEGWEHKDSPFIIVNPVREALVGRNLFKYKSQFKNE